MLPPHGGEWTSKAADLAAKNGQLETLKWIRANGGGPRQLWCVDNSFGESGC
jgi:hypothetical protein